ncbi:MAG: Na/Pi symporter [Fuerstiella sp.]
MLPILALWFRKVSKLSESLTHVSRDHWSFHSVYAGVLKCAAVGCILTFIVQSSSATLGITIGLAQIGVIPFETAAALVMGENVGTTITAWLASFGTTTAARRAAYFHMTFNVVGVLWITAIFQWYAGAIRELMIGDSGDPLRVTAAIATSHTVFNVTNTIFFLPWVPVAASWMTRLVPDRPEAAEEQQHLTNLDVRMVETPVIAVEQSRVEILRMADSCNQMMTWLKQILEQEQPDQQLMKRVLAEEQHLDAVQTEIVEFMSNLLSANVPHDITDEIRHQLRMADEFESVSDSISTSLKAYRKLMRRELTLPPDEHANVVDVHDMVAAYLKHISDACRERRTDVLARAKTEGDTITKHIKKLGHEIIEKTLETAHEERLDPRIGSSYNRQITAYRRVRDHALNIAEALVGEK